MDVEATEEEVQEVRLAKFSNSEQLLARNGSHTHVVQIANRDPLFNLAWQEKYFSAIVHVEDKKFGKSFGSN